VLYLTQFFAPIQQLSQVFDSYQQARAGMRKLRTLFAEPIATQAPVEPIGFDDLRGELRFEGVHYRYRRASTEALRGIDVVIPAGQRVALVGRTGAGKSTLMKLAARFYDPTEGRVLVDGHDLRDLEPIAYRQQLGYVPQEPFLFSGTIRDNIAFARPETSDDEVWAAMRAVGLVEVVERLADGIDTEVHERGQSLSSGERQLIALARAFIARPRVLVLDEATSNLDLLSETKIEAALDVLLEGRTAILIAHRLSTAMRADRIAVIDDGGVAELGSHEELLRLRGRYAGMYETWISGAVSA
jgi:ATP-binding cassette subfamily B protein